MEHGIKSRSQFILNNLDTTREHLLALSDDIWLSIDHNDNTALKQGVQFKEKYNTVFNQFDKLAQELSVLVQQFTNINLGEQVKEAQKSNGSDESQRIIKELDRSVSYGLDEDFTYKRPFAVKIEDKVFADVVTWKRLYEYICKYLVEKDADKFRQLPNVEEFISNRGNPTFSSNEKALRNSMKILEGVYAEIHFSANSFCQILKSLLNHYDISVEEIKIYLREDRDAEE